jgi:hypothetical protein
MERDAIRRRGRLVVLLSALTLGSLELAPTPAQAGDPEAAAAPRPRPRTQARSRPRPRRVSNRPRITRQQAIALFAMHMHSLRFGGMNMPGPLDPGPAAPRAGGGWGAWGTFPAFAGGFSSGPGAPGGPWASPDDNGDPSLGYRDPRWHLPGPPDGFMSAVAEGFYYPGFGVNLGFAAPSRVSGGMFVPGFGVMNSGGWYEMPRAIFDETAGGVYVPGFGIIDRPTLDNLADTIGLPVEEGTFIPGLGVVRASLD